MELYDEALYKERYEYYWNKFTAFGEERGMRDALRLAVARIAILEVRCAEVGLSVPEEVKEDGEPTRDL